MCIIKTCSETWWRQNNGATTDWYRSMHMHVLKWPSQTPDVNKPVSCDETKNLICSFSKLVHINVEVIIVAE